MRRDAHDTAQDIITCCDEPSLLLVDEWPTADRDVHALYSSDFAQLSTTISLFTDAVTA
jgi:hypothetical protein